MRASGIWLLLGAVALAACSSSDNSSSLRGPGGNFDNSGGNGFASGASSAGSTSAGTPTVTPPEKEEAQSYRAPVVSGRWVWTANPDTGKVAIVDAKSFSVRLADAGVGP